MLPYLQVFVRDSDVEHEGRQAGGRLVRVEMGALRRRAEDKAPFGGLGCGWLA